MQFTEDHAAAEFIIHSCDAGRIRVNETDLTESFMLLPGQPVLAWPGMAGKPLTPEHFSTVIVHQPELLILGTGANLQLPAPEIYGALLSREIGLEAMTTAAACRTYNLLAQDGRKVAACLILPA